MSNEPTNNNNNRHHHDRDSSLEMKQQQQASLKGIGGTNGASGAGVAYAMYRPPEQTKAPDNFYLPTNYSYQQQLQKQANGNNDIEAAWREYFARTNGGSPPPPPNATAAANPTSPGSPGSVSSVASSPRMNNNNKPANVSKERVLEEVILTAQQIDDNTGDCCGEKCWCTKCCVCSWIGCYFSQMLPGFGCCIGRCCLNLSLRDKQDQYYNLYTLIETALALDDSLETRLKILREVWFPDNYNITFEDVCKVLDKETRHSDISGARKDDDSSERNSKCFYCGDKNQPLSDFDLYRRRVNLFVRCAIGSVIKKENINKEYVVGTIQVDKKHKHHHNHNDKEMINVTHSFLYAIARIASIEGLYIDQSTFEELLSLYPDIDQAPVVGLTINDPRTPRQLFLDGINLQFRAAVTAIIPKFEREKREAELARVRAEVEKNNQDKEAREKEALRTNTLREDAFIQTSKKVASKLHVKYELSDDMVDVLEGTVRHALVVHPGVAILCPTKDDSQEDDDERYTFAADLANHIADGLIANTDGAFKIDEPHVHYLIHTFVRDRIKKDDMEKLRLKVVELELAQKVLQENLAKSKKGGKDDDDDKKKKEKDDDKQKKDNNKKDDASSSSSSSTATPAEKDGVKVDSGKVSSGLKTAFDIGKGAADFILNFI